MKLNFRKYGSGHPLFVLHGVFGSSDNWQTLGREFAERYTVYLIDLRNHGQSPHSDEMNYEVMSEDLHELMKDEGLETVYLLGHSMGGKTAMNFGCTYPEMVDRLVVVDISPRYYPPHHQEILEAFRAVDLAALESRKDAEKQLAGFISNFGVQQFLLKNLARDDHGRFVWKLHLDALEQNAETLGAGPDEACVFDKPTLFIGGTKSDYIGKDDHPLIRKHFRDVRIEMVPDAGHWVHAEKPQELAALVYDFLA